MVFLQLAKADACEIYRRSVLGALLVDVPPLLVRVVKVIGWVNAAQHPPGKVPGADVIEPLYLKPYPKTRKGNLEAFVRSSERKTMISFPAGQPTPR